MHHFDCVPHCRFRCEKANIGNVAVSDDGIAGFGQVADVEGFGCFRKFRGKLRGGRRKVTYGKATGVYGEG